jgi:flagellar biosynthetic protein FliQ
MNDTAVLHIALQAMIVAAKVSAPILLVSICVGFGISLIQSATQIQEASLSFVPKLVGVGLVLLIAGKWMLDTLVTFTQQLIDSAPHLLSG